jgi:allantoin racemase
MPSQRSNPATILVVNPNSNVQMTGAIRRRAREYAGTRLRVRCITNRSAPRLIETYADMAEAAPNMRRLVRTHENTSDGFVIACHYDPYLDMIKEMTPKPALGIGEASLRTASMLGRRFSLITNDPRSIPIHEELIRKYHLQDALASIRAPEVGLPSLTETEIYLEEAKAALLDDRAEAIVMGCAGLSGMDKEIQRRLGVLVLDGVICALFLVEGLIRYGVGTSKVRRYGWD